MKPFAESARVRKQVPDSHVVLVIHPFGDIPAHFVVDRQPAALRQQQNAHRRELLRNRRGAKNGVGRDGHTQFDVRHAIPVLVQHRPIPADPTPHPGEPALFHCANNASTFAGAASRPRPQAAKITTPIAVQVNVSTRAVVRYMVIEPVDD